MNTRLELSPNWAYCPVPWQNFANSIHSQHPYIPESVFWVIAGIKLRDEFNASIAVESRHSSYVEFKDDKDLVWFMLRWS